MEVRFYSEVNTNSNNQNMIYNNAINSIIYHKLWGINPNLQKFDKTGFIHLFIHLNCLFFFVFSIGFYFKSLGGCSGATS